MTDPAACHALLTRLRQGGKVTISEVRIAIGEQRAYALDLEVSRATAERAEAREAKLSLKPYTDALRIADLLNYRAESARSAASRNSLYGKAETRYEEALTILSELLQLDPTLQRHLDRDMDWGAIGGGGMVSSDVQAVPRVRYHKRRVFGEAEHTAFRSHNELKVQALEEAISEPTMSPAILNQSLNEEQQDKLSAKLKRLKDDIQ